MQYLSHSEACKFVQREAGMSRETFDVNIRPRLVERTYGERVKRYKRFAIEQAIEDPSYIEKEGLMFGKKKTVKDALEHTWETAWQYQKGARAQRRLKDTVADEIGHHAVRKLKYHHIETWGHDLMKPVNKGGKGLKPATVSRRYATLFRALKIAKVLEWVDSIPDKPPIPAGAPKDRYLTRDEEARLFEAIQTRREITRRIMPHVIGFLLDTGCRLSELMRLRAQDVMDDGAIFRDRKGGGNLKVPLTARARTGIKALHRDPWWQHWTRNVNSDDKDTRDKALETLRTRLAHEFTAIRKAAKLPDVSIHTCRHTCGTRLAIAGQPMHRIQHFLGHADITVTTKIYVHYQPNELAGMESALEVQESDNVVPIDRQRINED